MPTITLLTKSSSKFAFPFCFNTLEIDVCKCAETPPRVFDIPSQSKQKLRSIQTPSRLI